MGKMTLNTFRLNNLYGKKSFEIRFRDNMLILVAENGKGKTTLLQLFYLFITKQWNKLLSYDFESISASINQQNFEFNKTEYQTSLNSKLGINELLVNYPLYESFITDVLSELNLENIVENPHSLSTLEEKYDIPRGLLLKMMDYLVSARQFEQYNFDFSVLYLPTYRRIERSFSELFADMDERTEIFITNRFPQIFRDTSQEHENESQDLKNIFTHIWKERDVDSWKKHSDFQSTELVEFGMEDVEYKIANFVSSGLESSFIEQKMQDFLTICNSYLLKDEKMSFNYETSKVYFGNDEAPEFFLHQLSSGEKQIISIFCHLVLSESKKFVIIDEPEISLSIRWQEKFLEDILKCEPAGLLVATHSPFVISDSLRNYTAGINEFIV